MKGRHFAGVATVALGFILAGTLAFSQSQPPTQGPAAGGTPAWFLQGSFPDPGGRTVVDPGGRVTIPGRGDGAGARGGGGATGRGGGASRGAAAATTEATPPGCSHSPLCGRRDGIPGQSLQRVQWKQTLGYTFAYPYVLPPG